MIHTYLLSCHQSTGASSTGLASETGFKTATITKMIAKIANTFILLDFFLLFH